jgi:hypothetical protein
MRMRRLLMAAALASGGCFFDRPPDQTAKPTSPHEMVAMPANAQQLMQANVEACTRVYGLGQRILGANPELPQRLVFRAAASPDPEIFHQGTTSLVVTQKVVEMCKNDGELAAVLCSELGKMVAEREALTPLTDQQPLHPPLEGPTFNGTAGVANEDPMRLNELAQYEKQQHRLASKPQLLDPNELARKYLTRAGFTADELEHIKPILRNAAEHSDLEMQFHGKPRGMPFTPPGGA